MARKLENVRVVFIPHDGRANPCNPYDRLSAEERYKRLCRTLAKIALRNADRLTPPNGGTYDRGKT